jgi:MATE family multidrug resistance protein
MTPANANATPHARSTVSWGGELAAASWLSSRIALSHIARIAAALVNTVMMGWLGAASLAAGALTNSILLLLSLTASGVLQGTAALYGSGLARGRTDFVAAVARHGLVVTLAACVLVTVLLGCLPAALAAIGIAGDLVELLRSYVWWLLPGLFPMLWMASARYLLAAVGELRWYNVATVVSVAANAAGNYCLMYGALGMPALGLAGIAISTSLSNWLALGITAAGLYASRNTQHLPLLSLRQQIDVAMLLRIVRLGLPIGVILFVDTLLMSGAHTLMSYVGVPQLAAHGIAALWFYILLMVPVGISQAATARVAWAVGRASPDEVIRASLAPALLAAAFVTIAGLSLLIWPKAAVGLVASQAVGAEVEDYAASFIRVCALTQALSGLVVVLAGVMRGLRDDMPAMLSVLLGYWGVGLGGAAILAFPMDLGGIGIWTGITMGFAVTLMFVLHRFASRLRRIERIITNLESRDAKHL